MYRGNGDNIYTETEFTTASQRRMDISENIQSKVDEIVKVLKRLINNVRAKAKEVYARFLIIVSRIVKEVLNIVENLLDYVRRISDLIETVIRGLDRITTQLNSIRI